jgi:hypothetical protein
MLKSNFIHPRFQFTASPTLEASCQNLINVIENRIPNILFPSPNVEQQSYLFKSIFMNRFVRPFRFFFLSILKFSFFSSLTGNGKNSKQTKQGYLDGIISNELTLTRQPAFQKIFLGFVCFASFFFRIEFVVKPSEK